MPTVNRRNALIKPLSELNSIVYKLIDRDKIFQLHQ